MIAILGEGIFANQILVFKIRPATTECNVGCCSFVANSKFKIEMDPNERFLIDCEEEHYAGKLFG